MKTFRKPAFRAAVAVVSPIQRAGIKRRYLRALPRN
jgi:hypothetical protein